MAAARDTTSELRLFEPRTPAAMTKNTIAPRFEARPRFDGGR
jgi:hypothetical protein